MEKISIEVSEAVSAVSYKDNKGIVRNKTISTGDLGSVLSDASNNATGFEMYPANIRFKIEKGSSVLVGYDFPEQVAAARYSGNVHQGFLGEKGAEKLIREGGRWAFAEDKDKRRQDVNNHDRSGEIFNTVLPHGLTMVEYKKDGAGKLIVGTLYQVAMRTPFYGLETPIFEWPGSNVFPDKHNICIGRIGTLVYDNISKTGSVPWLFYNGVSNNDLTDHKFKEFKPLKELGLCQRPYDLYKFLRVMPGEVPQKFPDDILISLCTVRDFLCQRGYNIEEDK